MLTFEESCSNSSSKEREDCHCSALEAAAMRITAHTLTTRHIFYVTTEHVPKLTWEPNSVQIGSQ